MEKVWQQTGDCGQSQCCYVVTAQACRFVAAFALSLMIFGLYNPGWHCRSPTLADNDTASYNASFAFPGHVITNSSAGQMFFSQSRASGATNSTLVNTSRSYGDTCDVINSCRAVDFNPPSTTIVSEFGLICNDVWKAHLVISVLNSGLLVGGFVWGQVGERFGRKIGLYSSTSLMGVASALAVFSPTWQVYAVFTFFIGFGTIGAITIACVLSMEFLNSVWRARISSVPVWNAGIIVFAVVVYILRDWRAIHITTGVLCGLMCLGVFWLPESFDWLVLHGKTSRAKRVASNIAKMNGKPISENVLEEIVALDRDKKPENHCTYLDLFRTRQIRWRVIKLCVLSVVVNLVYEIIGFGIQSLPGNFYTNMILAGAIEFPGVLLNAPMANSLGRRRTGVVLLSTGTFCCATIVVLLLAAEAGSVRDYVISVMAFIARSAMQAIINVLVMYSAELLPTAVRNLGASFYMNAARFTGIFSPYLLPSDFASMVACFSVLLAAQLLGIAAFCSLAETKGKPLNDTIKSTKTTNAEPVHSC